ncbi:MAG TPA: hypothetical protein VGQ83_24055 [Polyangia bacterium]|jgi:hypothetical protein
MLIASAALVFGCGGNESGPVDAALGADATATSGSTPVGDGCATALDRLALDSLLALE